MLRTEKQKAKENRNAAILREWAELTAEPMNSRVMAIDHLARKYHLKSRSAIYRIINNN
jgi:hypothetical protein